MIQEMAIVLTYLRNNPEFIPSLKELDIHARNNAIQDELKFAKDLHPYYFQLAVEVLNGTLNLDNITRLIGQIFPEAILDKHKQSVTNIMEESLKNESILMEQTTKLITEFAQEDWSDASLEIKASVLKSLASTARHPNQYVAKLIDHKLRVGESIKYIGNTGEDEVESVRQSLLCNIKDE